MTPNLFTQGQMIRCRQRSNKKLGCRKAKPSSSSKRFWWSGLLITQTWRTHWNILRICFANWELDFYLLRIITSSIWWCVMIVPYKKRLSVPFLHGPQILSLFWIRWRMKCVILSNISLKNGKGVGEWWAQVQCLSQVIVKHFCRPEAICNSSHIIDLDDH